MLGVTGGELDGSTNALPYLVVLSAAKNEQEQGCLGDSAALLGEQHRA